MVLPLAASRLAHERGAGSVFNLNPSRLGRRKVKFAAQPIDFLGNIQACQAAAQQVTVRWGGFRGKFRETAHRTTPSREYRGEKIGGVRHYVRDVGVAGSNHVTPTVDFTPRRLRVLFGGKKRIRPAAFREVGELTAAAQRHRVSRRACVMPTSDQSPLFAMADIVDSRSMGPLGGLRRISSKFATPNR
jgi:hypothetical protein